MTDWPWDRDLWGHKPREKNLAHSPGGPGFGSVETRQVETDQEDGRHHPAHHVAWRGVVFCDMTTLPWRLLLPSSHPPVQAAGAHSQIISSGFPAAEV